MKVRANPPLAVDAFKNTRRCRKIEIHVGFQATTRNNKCTAAASLQCQQHETFRCAGIPGSHVPLPAPFGALGWQEEALHVVHTG